MARLESGIGGGLRHYGPEGAPRMSHIVILSLVFRPDNVSTAHLMAEVASDLHSHGYRVTVLTTTPHYNDDPEAVARQPLSRCWPWILRRSEYRGVDVYHAWMPRKGRNKLFRVVTWVGFHVVSTLAGLLRIPKPDLILAPSPPLTIGFCAWLLGRLRRAPFIYNVQEMYPDVAINLGALRNPQAIRLAFALERFVYAKAAAITVISERMRERVVSKGVPGDRLHLIPNFVDVKDFAPLPKDNEFSRRHGLVDKFVVSYAGNMGQPQNLPVLLGAAALLVNEPRIHLLLMGDGSERERLRRQAEELSLPNVTFLPYQPYSLMPQAYASVEASYVPQATGTGDDGVPSKVYRIMASARPVLACTDRESDLARLVTTADAGAVVTEATPEVVARAIRVAFESGPAWIELGLNGRRHVLEHYSRETVSGRYLELVNRLTAAPSTQRP